MTATTLSVTVVMLIAAAPLAAQSLADRVASVNDGAVTFEYTARRGICGDGEHYIRTGRHSYIGSVSSKDDMAQCDDGPVQVRLTVVDRAVTRVQYWVGRPRERNATDLGAVPAAEAARYLLTIAQRGAPGASAKAVLPAVLADSAVVWPTLLAIAKDVETRSKSTRQESMFWLSRYAGGAISGHRNDPIADDRDDDDPDEDLKSQAVFVLSQLPRGEGVPDLLQVARSNKSPRVRSQALFWLGQSGDPRALALFEEVLKSS